MMEFDAFISSSSRDKTAADATCAVLESVGIRCWIAPRDVRPGVEYGAAIIDAIERCRVMVLIFSSSANESRQVHREIERAVSRGIPIVPVRIEDVVPTKSMEYFLGAIHWLDALTPPLEGHLHKLAETVKAILQVDDAAQGRANNAAPLDKGGAAAGAEAADFRNRDQVKAYPRSEKEPSRAGWVLGASAIAACMFLVAGGIWFYQTRVGAPANALTAQATQPERKQATQLVPEAIPFVSDDDRARIREVYMAAPDYKALAIGPVNVSFVTGQPDKATAEAAALNVCQQIADRQRDRVGSPRVDCELYAVGNEVVSNRGYPPMPVPPWLVRDPAVEAPFELSRVPLLTERRRPFIKPFQDWPKPRALAMSATGQYGGNSGKTIEEAIRRALEWCGHNSGVACIILAVDDVFVLPIPSSMKVVGLVQSGPIDVIAPELRDDVAQRLHNSRTGWNAVAVGASGRAGLKLGAGLEQAAIDGALEACGKKDRDCRVIVLGPFLVARLR
jgi:TIR domain